MVMHASHSLPPRQRGPRTDPDLRDGDSGHGNPGEPAGDLHAVDSDTDVGDSVGDAVEVVPELAGIAADPLELPPPTEDELQDEPDGETEMDAATEPEAPITGYQRLTVPQVLEQAQSLSHDEQVRVLEFEKTHRNRKTLVARLTKMTDSAA